MTMLCFLIAVRIVGSGSFTARGRVYEISKLTGRKPAVSITPFCPSISKFRTPDPDVSQVVVSGRCF